MRRGGGRDWGTGKEGGGTGEMGRGAGERKGRGRVWKGKEKGKEDEFVLVVTIHHIATDAWSRPVIVKEVIELYSAFAEGREAILPKLPFQYSDYAIWQSEILNDDG